MSEYAVRDKRYTIPAATITISKLGPSGSLKNQNINLEHKIAVMPKISNEVFFEWKCIFVILTELPDLDSNQDTRLQRAMSYH